MRPREPRIHRAAVLTAALAAVAVSVACFGSSVGPVVEESDTLTVVRADTLGAPVGDPLTIGGVRLVGDRSLEMTVTYSGGCRLHRLELRWDGALHIAESDTVAASLAVVHEDNGDACEGLVIETQSWKLDPLLEAVSQLARPGPTVLRMNLRGWEAPILMAR
ncbi:MAG TPA: hypothetical protein VGA70_13070 [Longimicrobiales bacterium]|jgi:hypothetical protein